MVDEHGGDKQVVWTLKDSRNKKDIKDKLHMKVKMASEKKSPI